MKFINPILNLRDIRDNQHNQNTQIWSNKYAREHMNFFFVENPHTNYGDKKPRGLRP